MRDDSELRDALADDVARALAGCREELVDALMADLAELEPVVRQWSARVRGAVRTNMRSVVDGFVAFLPLGDLEAGEIERLGRLLDLPMPGTRAETGLRLLPPMRLHALEAMQRLVGHEIEDAALAVLERHLEAYVGMLRGVHIRPAAQQPGDLDAWLAEIEASGVAETPRMLTLEVDSEPGDEHPLRFSMARSDRPDESRPAR